MTTIVRVTTMVQPDGTIAIRAPELAPGQRVTVIVEAASEDTGEKRRAIDILTEQPGHRLFHTAEEVDAYIREERDSWEH